MTSLLAPHPRRMPTAAKTAGLALLLFAATFALYFPATSFSLVNFDDPVFIIHNPIIFNGFSWSALGSAFTRLHGDECMYVPLLWVSFLLDDWLFGASAANPWGFHFTNVLLHALNAVLFYALLLAFCRKPWRAFVFAALWALHPLRVESVAWVTERKDVLSGFFALSCLLAYVAAWRQAGSSRDNAPHPHPPRRGFIWLSFVLFAAGLLVKPMLVTIPCLLILLDIWPLRRLELTFPPICRMLPRLVLEKWAFFASTVVASVTVYLTQTQAISPASLWARLYAIPANYGFYLQKSFWPAGLHAMVIRGPISLASFSLFIGVLAGATAWAWLHRQRHPNGLVGWLMFLGLLFPVVGIVIIGVHPVADRYSYLPAIGLSIALLHAWPTGSNRHAAFVFRTGRAILAAVILATLALLTARQLPTWRDDHSLHEHMARHNPGHYFALHFQAREAFFTHGDFAKANRLADLLLEQQPCMSFGLILKMMCLSQLDSAQAALAFAQAHPRPCDNLGAPGQYDMHLAILALFSREYGVSDQAMREALLASDLEPRTKEQLHALAMLLAHDQGDEAAALAHAAQIASLQGKTNLAPDDFMMSYLALWSLGYHAQTLPFFQALARSHPQRPDLLNNIAWLLATTPGSPADPEETVQMAQQALALAPGHPLILSTLSVAQAHAGDFEAAVQSARQVARTLAASSDPNALRVLREVESRIALFQERRPYREQAALRMLSVR